MMQPLWTGAAIAQATAGRLSADFAVDSVAFDSREVIGGELFVALRGEAADGHDFVASAAERGAAGFLVERPVEGPHVLVADGLRGRGGTDRDCARNGPGGAWQAGQRGMGAAVCR